MTTGPTVEALARRVADLLGPRLEAHLAELVEQQGRPPNSSTPPGSPESSASRAVSSTTTPTCSGRTG